MRIPSITKFLLILISPQFHPETAKKYVRFKGRPELIYFKQRYYVYQPEYYVQLIR